MGGMIFVKCWITGPKATMEKEDIDNAVFNLRLEKEDIDNAVFNLAHKYMSKSGLMRLPCRVPLPGELALWTLEREYPTLSGNYVLRIYNCHMRHICGGKADIRIKQHHCGWMEMEITGTHVAR